MAVVFADSTLEWIACPKLCGATTGHSCCTWGFLITLSQVALVLRTIVSVAELALTVCPCSCLPIRAIWVTSSVEADAMEQQRNLFAFVWNV